MSLSLIGSLGSMSAGEVMKPHPSPFKTSSISSGAQGSVTFIPKMSSFVTIISSSCVC